MTDGTLLNTNTPALADLTTLRVGGHAREVVSTANSDELAAAVADLDATGEPILLVGGGSNLVVSDAGYEGTVLVMGGSVVTHHRDGDTALLTATGGAIWDDVVAESVDADLGGLECLSGIPGAAGATPVQNVGAYGSDVSDCLDSIDVFDRVDRAVRTMTPDELGLGYRSSVLKSSQRWVVLSITVRLRTDGMSAPIRYGELARTLGVEAGERAPVGIVRQAVLALRRSKGMVLDPADHDTWSAGSFFTNPIVSDENLAAVSARIAARVGDTTFPQFDAVGGTKLSAGWLIEHAGFARGYPHGDAPARLSTKHTLALTNRGTAKSADVVALAREVRDGVADAFGVVLHPEPILVGCAL